MNHKTEKLRKAQKTETVEKKFACYSFTDLK